RRRKRDVGDVESGCRERGVLHPRGERVRDGPAEDPDEARAAGDLSHGAEYPPTSRRRGEPRSDASAASTTTPRGTPGSLWSRYPEKSYAGESEQCRKRAALERWGCPSQPASPAVLPGSAAVSVRALPAGPLGLARREEMVDSVRLADVVQ